MKEEKVKEEMEKEKMQELTDEGLEKVTGGSDLEKYHFKLVEGDYPRRIAGPYEGSSYFNCMYCGQNSWRRTTHMDIGDNYVIYCTVCAQEDRISLARPCPDFVYNSSGRA
ncbi:MAG: hypothetical protein NC400_06520 [Clostridium sp.]|nr:hypothetical protein [Clostridium sp.]